MLIEFRVANYTVFREMVTLSAEPGAYLTKYKTTNIWADRHFPVLKNLLLFGPNGAGKTRLLKGLSLMQTMILNGGSKAISDRLPYVPFKFDDQSGQQPTVLGIRLSQAGRAYDYSFTYDEQKIISEKLTEVLVTKERVYFERQGDQLIVAPPRIKRLLPRLRPNALLLYLAQQENDPVAGAVFTWFAKNLLIHFNRVVAIPAQMIELVKQPAVRKELVSFMHFADFNIHDVVVREVPVELPPAVAELLRSANELPELPLQTQPALFTVHKRYNQAGEIIGTEELPLAEESLGTQQLFMTTLATLYAQLNQNETTIVVDEFGSSLHPRLTAALVRLFNSAENHNQYVLAAHDFNLLDQRVRTDQIYLVEKDFTGVSELKSVFDFVDARQGGRTDVKFAKKYMAGHYGAVPVIDEDELEMALKEANLELGGAECHENHGV